MPVCSQCGAVLSEDAEERYCGFCDADQRDTDPQIAPGVAEGSWIEKLLAICESDPDSGLMIIRAMTYRAPELESRGFTKFGLFTARFQKAVRDHLDEVRSAEGARAIALRAALATLRPAVGARHAYAVCSFAAELKPRSAAARSGARPKRT